MPRHDHREPRQAVDQRHVFRRLVYLAGTSAFAVSSALASRPHRLLSLGVQRTELRRYGTPGDHAAWQGLDVAGIRRSVTSFLGLT